MAYPIADPAFRVLSPEAVQKSLCGLRDRTRLPGTFILSVTHLHHSKNIETLLSAYGRLSPRLRQELALVIACHLTEAETEMIRWLASQRGIAEEVIITGLVTDDELVALYNAATLVIHPSRYEGFGLPVLEAMQCGAAVITTTASSLPEVGGDAVVLVDAEDDQEMADVIEALYMEPARREAMKYCGLQQVKKFSPDQLGQNTLDSYHQARQPCPQPDRAGRRPRIALWTPLPPQRSGISDYSVELLAPLARLYDIEVFVDDGYLPSMELWHRYVVEHYQAFERRHAQDPFDVVVYQMGASFYHWYMYEALQKWQGLVVLHDLTWGFVLHAYHSNSQRLRDFRRELLDMEGPQALREFESAERQSADPSDPVFDSFFDRHYMLKRIMEQGLAVMVHMDLAKREVEKLYRHSRVYHVPMGVEDPWRGRPTLKPDLIREQLGLSRTAFVAGVFGIVHRVKRVDVCLEAFHQVLDKQPDARLWIVGEPLDPAYMDQLQARMSGLGIGQHLYFSNRVAAAEFNGLLLACDVVINLRYPSRKQMSATLVRAIAAGKPIIITDIPEWAFLPDSFCWRVAPDSQEVATLSAYLLKLAADTALRQRMSASARSYYEQNCTAAYMAARYQSVIEQVTGYSSAESHDANH